MFGNISLRILLCGLNSILNSEQDSDRSSLTTLVYTFGIDRSDTVVFAVSLRTLNV